MTCFPLKSRTRGYGGEWSSHFYLTDPFLVTIFLSKFTFCVTTRILHCIRRSLFRCCLCSYGGLPPTHTHLFRHLKDQGCAYQMANNPSPGTLRCSSTGTTPPSHVSSIPFISQQHDRTQLGEWKPSTFQDVCWISNLTHCRAYTSQSMESCQWCEQFG